MSSSALLIVAILAVIAVGLLGMIFYFDRKGRPVPKLPLLALAGVGVSGIAAIAFLDGRSAPRIYSTPLPTPSPTSGASTSAPAGDNKTDLGALSKRLTERLEKDPKDAQGWVLLGRTHQETRKYADAVKAFEKAVELVPTDAQVWADLADATLMRDDKKWGTRAKEAVERAVKIDPKHRKSLWLAGTERYDAKDYKGALKYWQPLAKLIDQDSVEGKEILAGVQETLALAGMPPDANIDKILAAAALATAPATTTPTNNAAPNASGGRVIEAQIQIDDALRARVQPGAVIFAIIREGGATSGPPLATKRIAIDKWPTSVKLDASDVMIPGGTLNGDAPLTLMVRVSQSGDPIRKPGDLESEPVSVPRNQTGGVNVKLSKGVQ